MQAAIDQGGRKLDAFDTVLPELYSKHGFKTIARDKWNEDYKPDGWDKDLFAEFNSGEPDIVYMDWFEVDYPRSTQALDDRLTIEGGGNGPELYEVDGFAGFARHLPVGGRVHLGLATLALAHEGLELRRVGGDEDGFGLGGEEVAGVDLALGEDLAPLDAGDLRQDLLDVGRRPIAPVTDPEEPALDPVPRDEHGVLPLRR